MEGRPSYRFTERAGTINIVRPSKRPSTLLRDGFDILHLYPPLCLFQGLVEPEADTLPAAAYKLIDPRSAPDGVA